MSDDIPQDQVEAVARALCAPDMNYVCASQPSFPCSACRREAIAAIRVLTPLIAAVERERCAALNSIPILAAPISRLMELDQASVFALADIAAERVRQIEGEAWSVHHDDRHNTGEMAKAAACYALIDRGHKMKELASLLWPWDSSWFKPGSLHRNWIRAGALLVAELARNLRSTESIRSVKGAVT